MITATIHAWANALGKDDVTITRALAKSGSPVTQKRESVSFARVRAAGMLDDIGGQNGADAALERLRTAQAIEKEQDNRVRDEGLVEMGEVEKLLAENFTLPLRARLLDLPGTLDVRCNQQSPEVAHAALTQWVDETLKLLRDKLK